MEPLEWLVLAAVAAVAVAKRRWLVKTSVRALDRAGGIAHLVDAAKRHAEAAKVEFTDAVREAREEGDLVQDVIKVAEVVTEVVV